MNATPNVHAEAVRLFLSKDLIPADGGCLIYPTKPTRRGYGQLQIGGRSARRGLLAHRVAYEIAYGPIPDRLQIDHVCGVRRCVNPRHLRLSDGHQNQQNRRGATSSSTTGFRGVSRKRGRFEARVQVNGTVHRCGVFDTPEEAAEAAAMKRRELMPYSEMDRE